jgi:hypothetical protein
MQILLEESDLRPLIEKIVKETLALVDQADRHFDERLAYTEAEAAALLGVAQHVLRDCRLRGEVSASRCGRRIMYQRSDLLRLLDGNRIHY